MSLDDRPTTGAPSTVSGIPLSEPGRGPGGEPSIGYLVKNATTQVSALVRSEVELAKAEIVGEAKKAGIGTALALVAGVIALYASFFFFYFIAKVIAIWLPEWAAFGIVFLILLAVAVAAALIGFKLFKKITGPTKTISSVKEVPSVLPHGDNVPHGGPEGILSKK